MTAPTDPQIAAVVEGQVQEAVDHFYWQHGPCCAGCDHWRYLSSAAGECAKSAPISGERREAMLGMTSSSLDIGAGHPITPRFHHCGDFVDSFDWLSLPPAYFARVLPDQSRRLAVRAHLERQDDEGGKAR